MEKAELTKAQADHIIDVPKDVPLILVHGRCYFRTLNNKTVKKKKKNQLS
jgi:hypothetical protein